jgi:hypothetical protein
MAAVAKPFPAAPEPNLPTVLNAPHRQRAFTCFAIDKQLLAVDPASAPQLDDPEASCHQAGPAPDTGERE